MTFVILSGNPKTSGLCRSVTDEIIRGAKESGAEVFDYIHVNRWNSDYKRSAAYSAAKAIAGGRRMWEAVDDVKK